MLLPLMLASETVNANPSGNNIARVLSVVGSLLSCTCDSLEDYFITRTAFVSKMLQWAATHTVSQPRTFSLLENVYTEHDK